MEGETIDMIGIEMGRRLKRCRKAVSWTARELALQTGWVPDMPDGEQPHALSQSRIGNFEQGKRRIRNDEALILERVFEIPAGYFLGVLNEREADVIAALRGLRGSPSGKYKILSQP